MMIDTNLVQRLIRSMYLIWIPSPAHHKSQYKIMTKICTIFFLFYKMVFSANRVNFFLIFTLLFCLPLNPLPTGYNTTCLESDRNGVQILLWSCVHSGYVIKLISWTERVHL